MTILLTILGLCSLATGVCAIPFLFSIRRASRGRLPGKTFVIVAVTAWLYWGSGVAIFSKVEWWHWSLSLALIMTGVILLIGTKSHNNLMER